MTKLPPQSEASFTRQVIQLAKLKGWRVAHFRPAMTKKGWRTAVQGDGAGFFDLVLVRPPRIIFSELKSDVGRLSPAQEEWWEAIDACRNWVELHVWRPSSWDEIVRVLE